MGIHSRARPTIASLLVLLCICSFKNKNFKYLKKIRVSNNFLLSSALVKSVSQKD